MGMPGIWELVVIGGVIVLLFGAKKLPALGGAIGESIKNFKKGIKDASDDDHKSISQGDKDSKKL
jgi:sec-independent protein translocase protein TatA